MLKILANGPFVPNEIKRSRNNCDNAKKKGNINNNVNFHSNLSNKNTDFISTNNINNNISNHQKNSLTKIIFIYLIIFKIIKI